MDPFQTACSAAAAVRAKEVSPLELLEACLARVDRLNPRLNAIIWRNDDEARAEARRAGDALVGRRRAAPGPFHGVPLPVKDLTPVAGWPVTYGSWAAPTGHSTHSELVVGALRRAGFVLAGRTNTPELGPLPVTENLRYGVTRNPWDLERTPGGSSGGAAAAVAAGMFPVAHGNDGGGSLRIPASCTGLVGLKASRGRVPSRFGRWEGALVDGALTRDVRDAAALLDVVCGPDAGAWYNAPAPERPFALEVGRDPGRLRVAVQTAAPFGLPVHPLCVVAAQGAADVLADAGHRVSQAHLELLTEAALTGFVHVLDAGLAAYPGVDWSRTEPHVQAAHRRALGTDSLRYAAAVQGLQLFSRELTAAWGRDFDVLLTPTMTIPPPRVGQLLPLAHADPHGSPPPVLAMTAFTVPASLTGLPAVSLPTYQAPVPAPYGLPIGVTLVAGPWQDALLLRVAGQLEQLLPWRDRRPPLD